MTSIPCRMTRRRLDARDGAADELGRLAAHYESCLRCRVEAVRHRRLVRALNALATLEEVAPPGLAVSVARRTAGPQLVAEPGTSAVVPVVRTSAAVVGAVAAAAGTAVVAHVVRTRSFT